jgi:hypothetical protein
VRSVAKATCSFVLSFAETPADRGNETTELLSEALRNAENVFESGESDASDAYDRRDVVRESARVAPSIDPSNEFSVSSGSIEIFPESGSRDARRLAILSRSSSVRLGASRRVSASSGTKAFSFVSVSSVSFVVDRIPEDAFDAAGEAPAARSSRGARDERLPLRDSPEHAGYSSTGPASSQVTTASGLVDARVSAGALSSSNGSDAT